MTSFTRAVTLACGVAMAGAGLFAQAPATQPPAAQAPATPPGPGAGRGGGRGGPVVVSPQIESDGRVTFRVLAPQATTVTVGGDINGSLVPIPQLRPRSPGRAAGGCAGWARRRPRRSAGRHDGQRRERRLGRHDGARGQAGRLALHVHRRRRHRPSTRGTCNVSPSQTQVQSLLYVPGDFSETRDVPHGAVVAGPRTSRRRSAARGARCIVYTPPGYEKGTGQLSRCST